MTDIRSNVFVAQRSSKLVLISEKLVLKKIVRWIGLFTFGVFRLLSLVPVKVGRAFEMAYIDPFTTSSSHLDKDRR